MAKNDTKDITKVQESSALDKLDLTELSLRELQVLHAMIIYPTDKVAYKKLKLSEAGYYKIKRKVRHYKQAYIQAMQEDVYGSLTIAGKHAVNALVDIAKDKRGKQTRKDAADDILDRIGYTKKTEEVAVAPGITNIIATKVDQYKDD